MTSRDNVREIDPGGLAYMMHGHITELNIFNYLPKSWRTVVWSINGFFLSITVVFNHLSSDREGLMPYIALFALQEEKNVATYWEGWCLLLIAVLAFDRYVHRDRTEKYEMWSWLGLMVLTAGLSLDELGSIHERAKLLFTPWGLIGDMNARIPFAIPACLFLLTALVGMSRFPNRRCFRLTLAGAIMLSSVPLMEHFEQTLTWPSWTLGIRFGIEEGTELVGIFLLLSAVLSSAVTGETVTSLRALVPSAESLLRMRPMLISLLLLGFIPLGLYTVTAVVTPYRGVPAAWFPFMLLNLSSIAACICAYQAVAYRFRWLGASLLTLFFSFDQIIVFQRVLDKELIRGNLETLMLPCLAVVCLSLPPLRTRLNLVIIFGLVVMSAALIHPVELIPRLIIPLQALGVFYVLVSGLDPRQMSALLTKRGHHELPNSRT